MCPCRSVVWRIEMPTVSSPNVLAACAIEGAAQNKPACPMVLRNARRVGELTYIEISDLDRINKIFWIKERQSKLICKSCLILWS